MILDRRTWVVTALGVAQTLAWASSYYLPAILASPMARDLGVSTPTMFAAFSAALILSAVIGPRAGRAIDFWGGRPVLMITNVVFAMGLVMLASAHGVVFSSSVGSSSASGWAAASTRRRSRRWSASTVRTHEGRSPA